MRRNFPQRPSIGLYGEYLLDATLGQGIMSTVYLAYHVPTGEQRVLKVLRREYIRNQMMVFRFENEGAVLSQLRHPHIVHLIEQGNVDGQPYLALEYHPGATLRQVLKAQKGQRLEDRFVVELGAQIAEALAYAHLTLELTHCDVKPENIWVIQLLLDTRLLDFGFARYPLRYYGGPVDAPARIIGTIDYMAPEQLQGYATLDGRVDIYALGVVIFESLTGTPPYHSDSLEEMAALHAERATATLADLLPHPHPQLNRVLMKALELNRDDRWPSMSHFAQALRGLQQLQ